MDSRQRYKYCARRARTRSGLSLALLALFLPLLCAPAHAERLKDLASVAGVRDNPLLGYGLVVGLDGTGDTTSPFTEQSLRSMLVQYGVTVPPSVNISSKNVAAVSIHAVLPPFAKPGQKIDITASSLGNSKSLRGGTLLMSPLRGANGEVYAIAQGNLAVGGLGVSGADGSSIAINVPSVGRIPGGATVERAVPNPFADSRRVVFNLHDPDFTTARRAVEAINAALGTPEAEALDAVSVAVNAPMEVSKRVAFIGYLEELTIDPGEGAGKIIVNSRTGTIVIGSHVTVGPAAVTHGSLTVTIREDTQISQPEPFTDGVTAAVPDTEIDVVEEQSRMFELPRGTTLSDIVQAINSVGAAPGDLVAILEALKQAGALRAQLIII
ncbi:flagellar basal body P-ring protein FlgI [Granulosicoccus sp. 3-233]|uniref:flagellar basal body P-ring protein FlgI n=1 Tax=Granulosicoccus sp. 3-233 TaxID=3417969 RepID=UPI003D329061